MIAALGLTFNIVCSFPASGSGDGGRGRSRGGVGGAERGQLAGDLGDGRLREGAEGGEAAADDTGGDLGGTVVGMCEFKIRA